MQLKFPVFTEEDSSLSEIEHSLSNRIFVKSKQLKKFSNQLKKIDLSITKAFEESDQILQDGLERRQELVHKLAGRCHHLKVRNEVIHLAEDAERLANTSPGRIHEEVAKDADILRRRLAQFEKHHRPSANNAKFIRFARALIAKAERHEPVIDRRRKKRQNNVVSLEPHKQPAVSEESYELAELLYQLAGLLYQNQKKDFLHMLLHQFSIETQREISFHIGICGGSLDLLSKKPIRFLAVQGILGYAHYLTDYYMGETPYPDLQEIHSIFADLKNLH